MKHGIARLDSIWGVGGGQWPVKALTKQVNTSSCILSMCGVTVLHLLYQMNMILEEYIASSDLQEACRCISDLDVPHFHHEIVYEVNIAITYTLHEAC